MGKPFLPDLEPLIAAGINPKTGLPTKITSENPSCLKENTKRFLRLIDEQDACNRYVWYNLPCDLSSQELERMLYYRGQLCFFYHEDTQKFYFMPYTLDGTIDFYGRYNRIHPIPMTTGVDGKGDKSQTELLSQIKLNCVYGVKTFEDEVTKDVLTHSAVLLHDYTKQLSQTIIPRQQVNDGILDVMSDIVPYMNTALLVNTGVRGVRVQDADQAQSVEDASRSMKKAALSGDPLLAIAGVVEFQELTGSAVGKVEDYMLAMQSLDNLRLSGYGIDNGGLFEKKAHTLQSEADVNGGPVGLVMQDGLSIRQNFCNIVNSIWGLGIWCEPAENISGTDQNGDGVMYDRNEGGENSGVEAAGNSEPSGGEE